VPLNTQAKNEPEPVKTSAKGTTLAKKNAFRVYVVGGGYDYIRMLFKLGYRGAAGLGDADIVMFTGGEDVTPSLYGERPLARTHFNMMRDEREKKIYEAALEAGLPMVGICRGGQFLNVMNKGKMWQHVTDHCVLSHKMYIMDVGKGEVLRQIDVTSTHHQMMIPGEGADVLALAKECKNKMSEGTELDIPNPQLDDVEVVWYDKTNCLCFQPHPEFPDAPKDCTDYFEECMDNFIIPSTYKQEG